MLHDKINMLASSTGRQMFHRFYGLMIVACYMQITSASLVTGFMSNTSASTIGLSDMCKQQVDGKVICVEPYSDNMFEMVSHEYTKYLKSGAINTTHSALLYMTGAYGYNSTIAHNDTFAIQKRTDWINCNSDVNSGLEKYCCEKAHAVGVAAAKLGVTIIANLAVQYLQDSLEDPRIHESPRSICHYYDTATMCVSWAEYDESYARYATITKMATKIANCVVNGYSFEAKVKLHNGDIIYVCFSDRSSGCTDTGF